MEDGNGGDSLDSVVVTVTYLDPDNEPPVADAGDVQTVTEGIEVTLDGTGSDDPDGVIVSYLWQKTDGVPVALNNPASPNPSFTVNDVGVGGETFTFELTVTDDGLKPSTDTVVVNIIDDDATEPNHPPTAVADVETGEAVVDEGRTNVTLDGSGSVDTDAGDDISSYAWDQISGPGVVLYGTGPERNFTAPDVTQTSQLVFRLTVTDVDGLRSTDEVTIVVNWINEAPLVDPGENQTIDEGLKVQLDGSGSSDEDDGIASYQWTQEFAPDGSQTAVTLFNEDSAKAIFTAPDVLEDEILVFRLTVTDNAGVGAYDIVHVTVEADDTSPVSDAGPDQVVAFGASPVTLDGSGSSDPDGTIESYMWEEVAEPGEERVTLSGAATVTPSFTAPAVNPEPSDPYLSILFRLTVTDDAGNESVDSMIVNVTDDPAAVPPIADAGTPQTVSEGTAVTLDGSNSTDPDLASVIQVRENRFSYDIPDDEDETEPGNIVAVTRGEKANCDLIFESNNIENMDANFSIYLYGWADGDPYEVNLAGNWWGTVGEAEISDLIYDFTFDAALPEVIFQPFEGSMIPGAGSSLSAPPMADAGEDQTADPEDIVTLSCPEEYDPDQLFVYQWFQTGGLTVSLNNADTREATFVVPALPDEEDEAENDDANPLIFILTVTDPHGFSDTVEVKVTINEADEDEKGTHSTSGCFISAAGGQAPLGFIKYFRQIISAMDLVRDPQSNGKR